MKNRIYILVVAALFSLTTAQGQHKHEFSIFGTSGLSTLRYSPTAGELKNGFGGGLGAGYTYFFSEKIGLGTGVGLSFYNSKFSLNNFSQKYLTSDKFGDAFEFRSVVNGYCEEQRTSFLQIPLMVHYQTGKFYAAVGGKIAIPLSGTYESSGATIRNSGYYALENFEYTTQEFMGFGTFAGQGTTGDLDFKTAFMLSAEAGMKWRLSDVLSLYTGAFVDYGLNDIRKGSSDARFVQYNFADPTKFTTNSATQAFTDKVSLLTAGLKVQIAFGRGSAKRTPAPAYVPPVQQPDNTARQKLQAEQEARQKAAQEQADRDRTATENDRLQRQAEATTTEKARAELIEAKNSLAIPVDLFGVSQTALSASQKSELDTKIALLKKYSDLKVMSEGHTCDLGGKNINENIGLKRAEAAKAYLVEQGIAAERISTTSKGDSNPLFPNTNEENRRKNRRIELVIY